MLKTMILIPLFALMAAAQCADSCNWPGPSECFMCHTRARPDPAGSCEPCNRDEGGGQTGNFTAVPRTFRPAEVIAQLIQSMLPARKLPAHHGRTVMAKSLPCMLPIKARS